MKNISKAELRDILAWYSVPPHRTVGEGAEGCRLWRQTVAVSLLEACERHKVKPPEWLEGSVKLGMVNNGNK